MIIPGKYLRETRKKNASDEMIKKAKEKGISFNVFRKWEYAGLEFQEEVKTPDGNHRAEEDGHMVLVVKGFKRYIGL